MPRDRRGGAFLIHVATNRRPATFAFPLRARTPLQEWHERRDMKPQGLERFSDDYAVFAIALLRADTTARRIAPPAPPLATLPRMLPRPPPASDVARIPSTCSRKLPIPPPKIPAS